MIKKYIAKEQIVDGYERWVGLTHHNLESVLWVHYLDEEYLEQNQTVLSDQYIEGEIYIDLVVNCEESCGKGFEQPIDNSSHIVANIKITEILDEFSALCKIDGMSDLIKVEFERKLKLEIGQQLKVKGSLEIELK